MIALAWLLNVLNGSSVAERTVVQATLLGRLKEMLCVSIYQVVLLWNILLSAIGKILPNYSITYYSPEIHISNFNIQPAERWIEQNVHSIQMHYIGICRCCKSCYVAATWMLQNCEPSQFCSSWKQCRREYSRKEVLFPASAMRL